MKTPTAHWLVKIGMIIALPIFMIVMWMEKLIAKIFHLTYNEVNILIYYLFIPLSWAIMADYIIGIPLLSVLFLSLWIYIIYKIRHNFSHYCNVLFRLSQLFLLKFKIIGLNYVISSVIICVIVPILIYWGLYSLI